MIEITRSLARVAGTAFRRLGPGRSPPPAVQLSTGRFGLRLRAARPEIALEYHRPGAARGGTDRAAGGPGRRQCRPRRWPSDVHARPSQARRRLLGAGRHALSARVPDTR